MTSDHAPAGFFARRAMAFAIDSALLAALHYGFCIVLAIALTRTPPAHLFALAAATVSLALFFLLAPGFLTMVYSTVLHSCGGQTVGKIFMGLKVVTCNGEPLPPGTAFLRWVGTIVSALPLGAGFLWAAVSRDHATWHDKLTGTKVIGVPEQTS